LDRIKNGRYSDLDDPTAPFYGSVRVYPAYYGLHVNEEHNKGVIVNFSQKLDVWINSASTDFLKKPKLYDLDELHYFSVGLPGQNKDPVGRPISFKTSCGCRLPHGEIKVTLDDLDAPFFAPEQFIHCASRRCPTCLRYNTFVDSDDEAQRVWALRDMYARRGYSAVIYQIVLSPPQADKDPLAVHRWTSREGFNDLKKQAVLILKELGTLGGSLTVHHMRENGEDGIENGEVTGNDGDPYAWRLALHFHALAVFDFAFDLKKTAEIYYKTGWVVKLVINKGEFNEKKGQKFNLWNAARIKTLAQLKKKMFYLQSHASVMIPDDGGRALDSIIYFGGATHRKLREIRGPSGRPLYIEGYTEHDDKGNILYWYDDLARFAPLGLDTLAQVERANTARVYVDACDYGPCFKVIEDLKKTLGLRKCDDIPPADLWRTISQDPRFISAFEPMTDPPNMRLPKKEQLDGRDLWIFREAEHTDEYAQDVEYSSYCAAADEREAEYNAMKARALAKYTEKGGDDLAGGSRV